MTDYTGLTDEQASAARMADRGCEWKWCAELDLEEDPAGEAFRQALHDRDRFQRERDYWRKECINLTAEMLA